MKERKSSRLTRKDPDENRRGPSDVGDDGHPSDTDGGDRNGHPGRTHHVESDDREARRALRAASEHENHRRRKDNNEDENRARFRTVREEQDMHPHGTGDEYSEEREAVHPVRADSEHERGRPMRGGGGHDTYRLGVDYD